VIVLQGHPDSFIKRKIMLFRKGVSCPYEKGYAEGKE
jgi:hypothetical protein